MVQISGEIVIAGPIEEVFALLADARNEPLYNPRIVRAEKVSPGPIGLGTRFEQTARAISHTGQMMIEITEVCTATTAVTHHAFIGHEGARYRYLRIPRRRDASAVLLGHASHWTGGAVDSHVRGFRSASGAGRLGVNKEVPGAAASD
jgi:hypothetical protein